MGRRDTSTTQNNQSSTTTVDGYLRLEVVDSKGNKHRIPRDVALYVEKHISKQLIDAATADPDKEFTLIGTVHVIDKTPKEDIDF